MRSASFLSVCIFIFGFSATDIVAALQTVERNSHTSSVDSQKGYEAVASSRDIHLWSRCPSIRSNCPTFVICHGYGGTEDGDRFHQIADTIAKLQPQSNVIVADWSHSSNDTVLGMPDFWSVSKRIRGIAQVIATELKLLNTDPKQLTFIGESFGVCVSGKAAEALGGVRSILAVNPANELGGFGAIDLRGCCQYSTAIHTVSSFDSHSSIAHTGFLLDTPKTFKPAEQHTAGIGWLNERLNRGDSAWLSQIQGVQPDSSDRYSGIVRWSGEIVEAPFARQLMTAKLKSDSTATSRRAG